MHVDGDAVFRTAVGDAVAFHAVAVRSERLAAFRPKEHAHLAALGDVVVADHVVGIAVANGDAVRPALLDDVLLGQAVLHAPAEENADIIAFDLITADYRPLRPGTGVQTEAGVIVAVAILDQDIVADLPTDAVAVVIAGRDAANGETITVLEEDAAGVVAVQVIVVGFVAVERDVFDDDIGNVLAA